MRLGAAWNQAVSYLSGGLLYGTEVTPPKWFTIPPGKPQPACKGRRAEVTELLMAGWSFREIAQKWNVSKGTVEAYVVRTYRAHRVHGREELARALGRTVAKRERVRVDRTIAPAAAGRL